MMTAMVDRGITDGWADDLDALHARVTARFGRAPARPEARKNGWQLAEQPRESVPTGMQRLLVRAKRDADAVCGDLRADVVEQLGDLVTVFVATRRAFARRPSTRAAYGGSTAARRINNCQLKISLRELRSAPPTVSILLCDTATDFLQQGGCRAIASRLRAYHDQPPAAGALIFRPLNPYA